MKLFFAIMVFAICLFSLPSTSSGSGSPPDHPSFVVGHSVDFTAMVVNKEGGFVVDQGLFFERQHLYLNDTKPIESQIKNIESGSRCTIRADSQV